MLSCLVNRAIRKDTFIGNMKGECMKPGTRSLFAVCASALLVALLAACPNPIVPGTGGVLTISINNNINEKTLLPLIDMNAASFSVIGSGPGGAAFSRTTTGGPVTVDSLAFGSWSVTVNALNTIGTIIGSGQAAVTVHTGQTTTATVSVVPLEGNGTLELTVTWTAAQVDEASIEANLTPPSGPETPLGFGVTGNVATYSSTTIPAGYQTLTVQLLDRGITVMGAVEVVRIVAGQTTTGTYTFENVNQPGGSVQVNITPEMAEPIPVSISEVPATVSAGGSMTATASVSDGTTGVVYVWYLNGVSVGTGASYTLGSTVAAGWYRLDVTAYAAGGTRAGSATASFRVTGTANAHTYLYVANAASNSISVLEIGSTGALTMMSGSPYMAGTAPESLAVDPTGKFLFAANRNSHNISAYTIGSAGALTLVSGSPFAAGLYPQCVAVDRTGRFLYAANSSSGSISAYSIGSTGALTPLSGSPFATGPGSVSLVIDPTGRFLYVTSANAVSGYSIGSAGGLTPLSGSPFPAPGGSNAITIDPTGKFLYAISASSNNVSAYAIGPGGGLTPVSGSPFAAGANPFSVAVDPTGRFVYVANLNSATVSAYSIGSSGALTAVSGSPFASGTTPVFVRADPSGRFLYVANAGSNYTVSAFTIGSTGGLTGISGSPFYSGYSPFALAFVTILSAQ
jgi:6-phosphogluconolactonase